MFGSQDLDSLGLKFGTDKASSHHNYLSFYERYFAPLRDREIKLLEVGVFGGASLSVWEAYFPKATIIGADINLATLRFARKRVLIEIADQSSIEDLVQLGMKHGPFDIIIDDGSHLWEHQITTLKTLFPFVRNGGFFIVEDLQTNFGQMEAGYRGVSSISCVDYLKKLIDLRVADDQIDITQEEDPFLRTYGRAMNSIVFYRRTCLIEKIYRRPPVSDDTYVALDRREAPVPLFVIAHVGNEGDRGGSAGCIRPTRQGNFIQGFSLYAPDGLGCEIWYRARLSNLTWTDWMTVGQFAGSRGRGDNLTGFSVRFGADGDAGYNLEMVGEFSDSPEFVLADHGEDCVAPDDAGPLSGMQIVLSRKPA